MEPLFWYAMICIAGTMFAGALLRMGGAAADDPPAPTESICPPEWPEVVCEGAQRPGATQLRQTAERLLRQHPDWSAARIMATAKQQLIEEFYTSDPQSVILVAERQ